MESNACISLDGGPDQHASLIMALRLGTCNRFRLGHASGTPCTFLGTDASSLDKSTRSTRSILHWSMMARSASISLWAPNSHRLRLPTSHSHCHPADLRGQVIRVPPWKGARSSTHSVCFSVRLSYVDYGRSANDWLLAAHPP